jgi:hypothetical protein
MSGVLVDWQVMQSQVEHAHDCSMLMQDFLSAMLCHLCIDCSFVLQTPTPHPQGYCVPRACVSRGPLDVHFRAKSPQQKRAASVPGTILRHSRPHLDHDLCRGQGQTPMSEFGIGDACRPSSQAVSATLKSTSAHAMSTDACGSAMNSTGPLRCGSASHKCCSQLSNCGRTSHSLTPRLHAFAVSADSVQCKATADFIMGSSNLSDKIRTDARSGPFDEDMKVEGTPMVSEACSSLPVITGSSSVDRHNAGPRVPGPYGGKLDLSTTPAVAALRQMSPVPQEAPCKMLGLLRRASKPPRTVQGAQARSVNERDIGRLASDVCHTIGSRLFLGSDSEFCGGPGVKRQKCADLAFQDAKAPFAADSCPHTQRSSLARSTT